MEPVEIQQQVIKDEASGLTLTFWRTSGGEGRLRIMGDLPFGNRDFQFDESGSLVGTGTSVGGPPSHLSLLAAPPDTSQEDEK